MSFGVAERAIVHGVDAAEDTDFILPVAGRTYSIRHTNSLESVKSSPATSPKATPHSSVESFKAKKTAAAAQEETLHRPPSQKSLSFTDTSRSPTRNWKSYLPSQETAIAGGVAFLALAGIALLNPFSLAAMINASQEAAYRKDLEAAIKDRDPETQKKARELFELAAGPYSEEGQQALRDLNNLLGHWTDGHAGLVAGK